MNGKRCFKCGAVKNRTEFYRHPMTADGLLGKCKECTKSDVKEHRAKNLEKIREYDRNRANLPHRIKARTKYQKSQQGKTVSQKSNKKWMAANQVKRAAQIIFGNARKNKRVQVWPACCIPECNNKPQAHHPDYDRPLDVVWLCSFHHAQAHKILNQIKRESHDP